MMVSRQPKTNYSANLLNYLVPKLTFESYATLMRFVIVFTSSLAISQPDSRWILTQITWTQVEATFYVLITFNKLACQKVHPNINIRTGNFSSFSQSAWKRVQREAKWSFFIKVVIISRLVSWCIVETNHTKLYKTGFAMYLSFEQYLCGSADFLICCNLRMRPHITQYTSHSTQHTAHSTQYSRAISQAASRCASFGELPLRRHEDNSEVDDLQPF